VPDGHTINTGVYSQQVEKMYTVLVEKNPALVNRKCVLLQQDNARPHTVKKTLQIIEELEGIELLPHPNFSPDLEPSDYYLFRSMAQFLRGKKFQSVADVEVAVEEFFASKDKEWLYQAFKELAEKWVKTIEHEGLYFEHLITFILYVSVKKKFVSNLTLFMGHHQSLPNLTSASGPNNSQHFIQHYLM
jgi:histone-lysine N-methyltransferase SETMAR